MHYAMNRDSALLIPGNFTLYKLYAFLVRMCITDELQHLIKKKPSYILFGRNFLTKIVLLRKVLMNDRFYTKDELSV